MRIIQNLSIKSKLLLISIIPVTALLLYMSLNVIDELNRKEGAKKIVSDVIEIEKISTVLHELQKERSLNSAFVISEGKKFQQELYSQRSSTDQSIQVLKKDLKRKGKSLSFINVLGSLSQVRAQSELLQEKLEVDKFYLETKYVLLDEIGRILRSSNDISIKNSFEEHLSLVNTKEYLAQLRTSVGKAISKKKLKDIEYARFAAIKGKHDLNFNKYKKVISGDNQALLSRKYENPYIRTTYEVIDSIFINPAHIQNYAFDTWWDIATMSINALKELENESLDEIRIHAEKQLSHANDSLLRTSVFAVVIILLVILLIAATIKAITTSIKDIKKGADQLAIGEVDVSVAVKSKDEIGGLAESFKKMIAVTKEFTQHADAIGKGDYNTDIKIRSEKDILGIGLNNMRNNLQKISKENEVRNWLLTGNSELNDKMRGEKDLKELSRDIINQIVSYLKAQIGAIYIQKDNYLTLTASYAFDVRKQNINKVKIGEGLIGQAALEKKNIVFTEIPEDYFKINSGLGNVVPKNILVFPFTYEDNLKGVIELGTVHQFSDLDLKFLDLVSENIAIAFHACQSRTVLKDLLEETQRQAEELESQQEELRQSNEELLEKTDMLERSESELKTQQEELQQTNEELEEKANLLEEQKEYLENTKMDLENKARELEMTSKYKSEFLSNMSHELRTPLNSILILAKLLSENKSKSLGTKEVEFSRNIYNSGNDLLNLINEILDLSKVESGKLILDVEEIRLGDIASNLESMFSQVAENKSIKFNIDKDKVWNKKIVSDKLRMEQILRNLLSNAFKFTKKQGTVDLRIEYADKNILFQNENLQKQEKIISFSVADTGIGIPKNKQAVIFEAFQQADGSTKRKYGGTGLGLSISRQLATALDGEIHVESEEGKGSRFTLYLPEKINTDLLAELPDAFKVEETGCSPDRIQLTTTIPVSPSENITDDRENLKKDDKTVLIIEDDESFSKILLDFVRQRSYKGITAAQGNIGLSYARQYKPDAIILDMKLPVVNGEEVLRQLKSDTALRHIPVQIISGYDKKKEGLELGAFNFLKKPVKKEQFEESFEKIETFIERSIKRLLIIEDDITQNTAIKELVGNSDVMCYSAFSGQEAQDLLSKESFDCIIVDIGLPDMTGFELLEDIKKDIGKREIPTIVYTGKDLTKEETSRLKKLSDTIVLKTANSHDRLFDETALFLHRVEATLPKDKQQLIRSVHKPGELLNNKKVLIVDDDIRNIFSLTNALEEEGLICSTAENGRHAIQVLKEIEVFDIILMDVMMPELDGYDATREIRKMSAFAEIPIIALTAKAMKGDKEKCLKAGMSDYIAKPVNIDQLLSLMRVWLYNS